MCPLPLPAATCNRTLRHPCPCPAPVCAAAAAWTSWALCGTSPRCAGSACRAAPLPPPRPAPRWGEARPGAWLDPCGVQPCRVPATDWAAAIACTPSRRTHAHPHAPHPPSPAHHQQGGGAAPPAVPGTPRPLRLRAARWARPRRFEGGMGRLQRAAALPGPTSSPSPAANQRLIRSISGAPSRSSALQTCLRTGC